MADTPDRSELRRDFHEVVDSQVRLGHAMTLVPTDALAGLLAMADALDSRDARIAELEDVLQTIAKADVEAREGPWTIAAKFGVLLANTRGAGEVLARAALGGSDDAQE